MQATQPMADEFGWYVPGEHWMQRFTLGIPMPVLYVPGTHSVQLSVENSPLPVEYVPSLHKAHAVI
jgi:hypothetical protein